MTLYLNAILPQCILTLMTPYLNVTLLTEYAYIAIKLSKKYLTKFHCWIICGALYFCAVKKQHNLLILLYESHVCFVEFNKETLQFNLFRQNTLGEKYGLHSIVVKFAFTFFYHQTVWSHFPVSAGSGTQIWSWTVCLVWTRYPRLTAPPSLCTRPRARTCRPRKASLCHDKRRSPRRTRSRDRTKRREGLSRSLPSRTPEMAESWPFSTPLWWALWIRLRGDT